MIDLDRLAAMPEAPSALPDIDTLDLEDLLALHERIEKMLPPTALADVNLERALVMQYHRTQALQTTVMGSKETPANQKAQVANTCAATLAQLGKMQNEVYTAERMKVLERALILSLKTLPKAAQEVFIDFYERTYGAESMRSRMVA